jgi:hypothetical protein
VERNGVSYVCVGCFPKPSHNTSEPSHIRTQLQNQIEEQAQFYEQVKHLTKNTPEVILLALRAHLEPVLVVLLVNHFGKLNTVLFKFWPCTNTTLTQ